jgi:hypothetical protein
VCARNCKIFTKLDENQGRSYLYAITPGRTHHLKRKEQIWFLIFFFDHFACIISCLVYSWQNPSYAPA